MKNHLKAIVVMLLAAIIGFAGVIPINPIEVQADGGGGSQSSSATYRREYIYSNGNFAGVPFYGTSGVINGVVGTCSDPYHAARDEKGSCSVVEIERGSIISRVAYYLYKHGYKPNSTKYSKTYGYQGETCQVLISFARCDQKYKTSNSVEHCKNQFINNNHYYYGMVNNCLSLYKKAKKEIKAKDVPDRFTVYFASIPGNSNQDPILWTMVPAGKATLVKSSSNTSVISLSGYNSFAGVTYDLYKKDKATKVGTFTCNANGKSNTISDLAPGTFYAKEVSTNDYYKLNQNWIKVEIKSGKTTTVKDTDDPEYGNAYVTKKEKNGKAIPAGVTFHFHLVNIQNRAFTADVAATGNGSTAVNSNTVQVPAGRYEVTETAITGTEAERQKWAPVTTIGYVDVPPKGTGHIDWINERHDENTIRVVKNPLDGGPRNGFTFRLTGILDNNGTITANQVLSTVNPTVTLTDPDQYDMGTWTVNAEDVAALNTAAKNRSNETFEVRLTNKATHKSVGGKTAEEIVAAISPVPTAEGNGTITSGTIVKNNDTYYEAKADVTYAYAFKTVEQETVFDAETTATNIVALLSDTTKFKTVDAEDINFEVTAKIYLKDVEYDAADDEYKSRIGGQVEKQDSDSRYTLKYNDFNWYGSATAYKDVVTGQEYSDFVTNDQGVGICNNQPYIDKGIAKGHYTLTERLTPAQAERYKVAAPKEVDITSDESIVVNFTVDNEPYWTDVKLKKTDPRGNVGDIRFRLTGTTAFGDNIDRTAVTDAEGNLDFGKLHKGEYVVEELDFDEDNYINNHALTGYENPAMAFRVTGEEDQEIVIPFDNKPKTLLQITKIDGESFKFLENAEFNLYEKNGGEKELVANFQIVENDDGTPGINMKFAKGKITGKMNKTLVTVDPANDESDESEPETIIVGDDDDDDTPSTEPGGNTSGDGEQGNEPSGDQGNLDPESLMYAEIQNLKIDTEYILEEIRTPAGGYVADKPIEFTFNDPMRIIVKNYLPEIKTEATGSDGLHVAAASKTTTIKDTVTYKNLSPGGTYVMKGYLVCEKPQPEENFDIAIERVKSDGKDVSAEKEFTASETGNGTVELTFTFDARNFTERGVVVFEELYTKEDLTLIANHTEAFDQDQTVHILNPKYNMYKIRNELAPDKAGNKFGFFYGDKVTYSVFIENTGNVDLTMNVSDSYVEPEKFSLPIVESVENATQNSLSEDKNTVNITVKAGQTAKVIYSAIVKDDIEEYLADAAKDSDSLKNGKDCNRTDKDNTPDDNDGYVNIAKTTDVEYDNPYNPGQPKTPFPEGDKKDDAQTPVQKPQIGTTLIDSKTADHIAMAGEEITLIDEVTYAGLTVGKTYVMNGELKNKETGETAAVAEPFEFVPEKNRGKVEIPFTLSSEGNETFVAFEELYEPVLNPETGETTDLLIAEHKDLNDPDQTVFIPKISTNAKLGKNKVIDKIEYENLLPGRKYVAKGYLVFKSDKMKLKYSDGEKKFTPKSADGHIEVDLPIKFEMTKLAGEKLVAVESMYIIDKDGRETLVAQHKDLNDKSQTVEIPPLKKGPGTGDTSHTLVYIIIGLASGLLALAAIRLKKQHDR